MFTFILQWFSSPTGNVVTCHRAEHPVVTQETI